MPNTIRDVYNIDYSVKYTEDEEYRECFREVFCMKTPESPKNNVQPIDEIYEDEDYGYNSVSVKLGLDYIFIQTKKNEIFYKLYEKAAATLLSTDLELGLAILFSYDYFHLFHLCLYEFFNGNLTEETECVKKLNILLNMK